MTEEPRHTTSFRPSGPVIRAEEVVPWFDGQAYLADARRLGDLIVTQARQSFEDERRRGYEEGRAAGIAEAARLIAQTQAQIACFVERIEAQLSDIVVDIMGEILEAFEAGEVTARAIAKALKRLDIGSQLTVLVTPDDVEEVRARLVELLGLADGQLPFVLRADPQLDAGRCLLISEFGQVDVSVRTQLRLISDGLLTSCGGDPN
jgi:type III secretion protein L